MATSPVSLPCGQPGGEVCQLLTQVIHRINHINKKPSDKHLVFGFPLYLDCGLLRYLFAHCSVLHARFRPNFKCLSNKLLDFQSAAPRARKGLYKQYILTPIPLSSPNLWISPICLILSVFPCKPATSVQ